MEHRLAGVARRQPRPGGANAGIGVLDDSCKGRDRYLGLPGGADVVDGVETHVGRLIGQSRDEPGLQRGWLDLTDRLEGCRSHHGILVIE